MNKILLILRYKILGPIYHNLIKYIKYRYYQFREPYIIERIKKKDEIKVLFFVINLGMWKLDSLVELLLQDKRFKPLIVSYIYPKDSMEYRDYVQGTLREYFESKGFPYVDGYNSADDTWFNYKEYKPDIVFYAQPYNLGKEEFLLERVWKNSLFAYVPYCLSQEKEPSFYNKLYCNICWRLYYPTLYHKKFEGSLLFNKGKNIVVVGNPVVEDLVKNKQLTPIWHWKENDLTIKRIIWAPHHTFMPSDVLQYSNFLEIAEHMQSLTKKYRGKVQFCFKPHPRLKTKLYMHKDWGKEKTDAYYKFWAESENTTFVEGDYIDLFRTSDAMIHECSSFSGEYLATGKPVMFVTKKDSQHLSELNQFGIDCYMQHYHGYCIDDIIDFIDLVVLNSVDKMKESRISFMESEFMNINEESFSERIYNDIKNSLI